MTVEDDLKEFKAEIVFRALKKKFPRLEIDHREIFAILNRGGSVEIAYQELGQVLRVRGKPKDDPTRPTPAASMPRILERFWRALKTLWS